jgi:hypothetical protein
MGAQQSHFGEVKTSVYKLENEGTEPTKIRYGYYKNSTDVYYNGVPLKLSKRENGTFKKLKYSYAKTRHFVFYEGVKIPGADPKTFVVIKDIKEGEELLLCYGKNKFFESLKIDL